MQADREKAKELSDAKMSSEKLSGDVGVLTHQLEEKMAYKEALAQGSPTRKQREVAIARYH